MSSRDSQFALPRSENGEDNLIDLTLYLSVRSSISQLLLMFRRLESSLLPKRPSRPFTSDCLTYRILHAKLGNTDS